MAIIIPFVKEGTFDQKDITAMSTAPDDVCEALSITGDDKSRETIATRIIAGSAVRPSYEIG